MERRREKPKKSGVEVRPAYVKRTCRSRNPISYKFEEFDELIMDAIQEDMSIPKEPKPKKVIPPGKMFIMLLYNASNTPCIRSIPKGYIVFVGSVRPFIFPSFHPSVIPFINSFYKQDLLRSFLITYISAATDQKLFICGIEVPWRVLFHSTFMNPWVMLQDRARGQNLGHPNKVVYCSLFIQTTP